MQKISTCLVFNDEAEEAAEFYCSLFKVGKILSRTYRGENEPGGSAGSLRSVSFELHGQHYLAVNGGPHFQFNDGVSLMIQCETQSEIDFFWDRLSSSGGREVQCGWVIDRFGVRWQVVPRVLAEMMADPDESKSQKVMQAILTMKKIDLAVLKSVYGGEDTSYENRIYMEHDLH